jgi:predicted nucleic acid-binding protein
VKSFFDTTILVAALLPDHPHHARSFPLFASANRKQAACAAHSLSEAYSTFTKYPGKERMSTEAANLVLEGIEQRLTVVWLDGNEYCAAIRRMAGLGIVGSAVYDGLVAACALKAGADRLYTWNVPHFEMLGGEIQKIVTMPPAV